MKADSEEQRSAEEPTPLTLSLLRATLESTADGILVVDTSGKIVDFNRRFTEMWRIPEPVLASRNDGEALSFVLGQMDEPKQFISKVQELYSSPAAESFDVLTFRDGRIFERYSRPQRLGETVVGRVWSFRDVTQVRRAEEELRSSREQLFQSQKMEAVGRLAGGVAHDFNNLLTAVTGYADLLLRRLPTGDPSRSELQEIKKAGERAAALTRQLLAFSRKQLLKPKVLDLNGVVADIERMLRRLIGENVTLSCHLQAGLGRIKADQGQIEQVIVNLAVNARDAMPSGGRLRLETSDLWISARKAQNHPGVPPGRFVLLTISDSGIGMDGPTLGHLFEPFFTTKERGKGTGLGLSTVYGIIRQSGGYVRAESHPGEGSTFRIYLPRTEEAPESPVAQIGEPGESKGSETVLVVEDEDSVRELVTTILSENGYHALQAADGGEALEICSRQGPPIHLILTDVIMPRMNGKELYERVRGLRSDFKILYMSGYAEGAAVATDVSSPHPPFLNKPFSPEALVKKVREVLDSSPPDDSRS